LKFVKDQLTGEFELVPEAVETNQANKYYQEKYEAPYLKEVIFSLKSD